MQNLANNPVIIFVLSLLVLWLSAQVGIWLRKRRKPVPSEGHDSDTLLAATLTLLGLIIGFSFSMAISRYDLRKSLEESEANAIGTEYVRTTLLPAPQAAKVRELLNSYLNQRILFYETRDPEKLAKISANTSRLQDDLWLAVATPAMTQPTAVTALVASGMNDVLNSQGYTQAAWWNRIPFEAWALLAAIAICGNILFGVSTKDEQNKPLLFFVLPFILSISFFLIADIDSPRSGLIRVHPQNLMSLANNLPR
jgi:hypothetical protein